MDRISTDGFWWFVTWKVFNGYNPSAGVAQMKPHMGDMFDSPVGASESLCLIL